MLAFLSEISITCVLASYFVVLVLELLRLFGRIPGRGLFVIGMMSVGLFTHICYLMLRATASEGAEGGSQEMGLLATWSDWSLLLALGLAIAFFVLYLRRPDTIISFFFLPAVMGLLGLAIALGNRPPFSRTEAIEVWRSVHAIAMMAGRAHRISCRNHVSGAIPKIETEAGRILFPASNTRVTWQIESAMSGGEHDRGRNWIDRRGCDEPESLGKRWVDGSGSPSGCWSRQALNISTRLRVEVEKQFT